MKKRCIKSLKEFYCY